MSKEKKKKLSFERNLDINNTQSGCSWNSAFATASSVQLEQLDNDFLERTQSRERDKGLAAVAELVKQVAKDKNTKIDEADEGSHEGSLSTGLIGKMVAHPISKEDFMILLNEETKDVYSTLQRDDSGNLIKIGHLRQDGSIEWHDQAFSETNESKEQLFPYDTHPDDHCESPLNAYEDIVPLVESLFKKEECKIYDPYYCDGAVKRNLKTLGFPSVHNVKEDCYQIWSKGKVPKFDILMTNPPYSENHLPKLVAFLSSSVMKSKPWFLLMPQWVSKKPYFADRWDKKAFFVVPKRRYVYYPPKNFREKKASDVHKKSSPFVTIWFVWGGSLEKTRKLYDFFRDQLKNKGACDVTRSKNGLRDLRRKGKRKRCDS
mmetsp:Transcript_1857/g.2560  ORF Transcript_1857/g.2560 Transcript_1857/m.2560 type:complete len:375 (-) Transcript_1857:129-1253(-)|eukprot:CAMPEP_0178920186 /NCGR_PEP_ID=MMETSP0786-20121207/14865_1 /TAXON_ID=186022 /ORGANISM="Thalassionema frauenfeldii, Strain CCMP 1798" /LENGTH=374 /DNA_ID=CAMNT_0020594225 /DNA_START=350 /DNA_END=1474 /DNA_ORIENTATION=-